MSRWIDAGWLKELYQPYESYNGKELAVPIGAILANIDDAPSIDIVRCGECKYWIGETEHYEDREYKACWQLCGQYVDSEFWCKYGEREGE